MAPGDKSRNHTSVAQIPHTETKPYLQNVAVPRGFERHSHVSWWRPDWLAGAGGLEPPNGGIKIQVFRVIYQCAFRKNAEIRPQSAQEVSRYFGMPGWTSRISLRGAFCPPKAEVVSSNLAGRAT